MSIDTVLQIGQIFPPFATLSETLVCPQNKYSAGQPHFSPFCLSVFNGLKLGHLQAKSVAPAADTVYLTHTQMGV